MIPAVSGGSGMTAEVNPFYLGASVTPTVVTEDAGVAAVFRRRAVARRALRSRGQTARGRSG